MNRTNGTRRLAVLVTGSIFLMSSLATAAQTKVVVVPLGGAKVAGTNGQLQYNDDGTLAGAEVHYDKSTGVLEAKGEIRSTDHEGNNRLWGEGRPGVSVPIWTPVTTKGFQQGRSNQATVWDNTAAGCPKATWVCTIEDWDPNFALGDHTLQYNYYHNPHAWILETTNVFAWFSDRYDSLGISGYIAQSTPAVTTSSIGTALAPCRYRPLCCKIP